MRPPIAERGQHSGGRREEPPFGIHNGSMLITGRATQECLIVRREVARCE
jgi:hypothetical protein